MSTIQTPYVRAIHPSPAHVEPGEGLFTFGSKLSLFLSPSFTTASEDLEAVKSLWDAFTVQCCPLTIQACSELLPYQAWFGQSPPSGNIPGLMEEDTYLIQVTKEGAWLAARDYPSFCHGFTTLLQLMQPRSLKEGQELFTVPYSDSRSSQRKLSLYSPLYLSRE